MAKRCAAKARPKCGPGRTANGRIKPGYKLTKAGVRKAPPKRRTRRASR